MTAVISIGQLHQLTEEETEQLDLVLNQLLEILKENFTGKSGGYLQIQAAASLVAVLILNNKDVEPARALAQQYINRHVDIMVEARRPAPEGTVFQ